MRSKKELRDQANFCRELMDRLATAVCNAEISYGRVLNHTQMGDEIIRLRRELNMLGKLLVEWDYRSETK